jgi:hypothetical protein
MYRLNVIGIPLNQAKNKTTLLFVYEGIEYNWTEATTTQNPTGAPLVLKDIFGWQRQQPQAYFLADLLEPGARYWIYSFENLLVYRTP